MTLAEAQTLMLGKGQQELWTDVEVHGNGFVISPQLLGLISNSGGSALKRSKLIGDLKYATTASTAGTVSAVEVGTGKIWDVLAIQCEFLADATVIDRTANLYIPETGMETVAGTSPTTQFDPDALTLSASQYGYIIWMKGEDAVFYNDNGTTTRSEDDLPRALWLRAGGDIQAKISANGQAGDNTGLSVIYLEYDEV